MPQERLPRTLRIAAVNRIRKPDWEWVFPKLSFADQLDVTHYRIPPARHDGTWRQGIASALEARRIWREHQRESFDLILSFLPGCAAWVEQFRGGRSARHDLFAFNFTDLPQGSRRAAMGRAFSRLHQGFVFTEMEARLYAEAFGLDRQRLVLWPWGVQAPEFAPQREIEGPYIAALGGEARDYAVLMEAARLRPDERFVIVARPKNLVGLDVPRNVTVLVNIPPERAWSVLAHADAHVLPMRSTETPCGIVSLVGAMHLGVPQVVTAAEGVLEYASDGREALAVEPGSAMAIAEAIDRLRRDEALRARLGAAAKEKAARFYSEETTVRYAEHYLRRIAEEPTALVKEFAE
ncbi:glycosyltransferase family 4 protein [Parvularcula lutaonensis]|uniref:Glycosyltransferase family 4 protein n=1 Tax=Parvularcula lutaonensis TaxID=491923 RepID=A0ABV7MAC8_9PROT|nr:glycosyltransferase family 4 protein [Parvularcula lutaonensis]GGY47596.1 hypothetical protein GCM10007148_16240 [Parvularcula lutaonensis]